ncbi:MAG TPA: DNA polymerase I [Chthonomonadaceae bacterium]|nr:DNA polymerase I [Chthonomonadaceae bacterium]
MVANTSTAVRTKKLVLVDAYSLLFRAFFAGRYLSTTDNRPTGALYGFTNMLFSLLNNEKPDAIVVCWDAPEQTHRSREYEAYKAHRPEVDTQLIAQMPMAREIIRAFGIQSAELGGYEADDLIGTLAVKGAREGYAVTILTGDSDQLQLVDDGITVQMTQRGVSDVKLYDAEAVRERYGVGPEQIADWKALVGDTSDNIPGVPGIGEKTATGLLQQWGTLENILAHLPEVTPPKARAALEANVEQARFSKRLATIVRDAPIAFEIRRYAPTEEDWERVRDLFTDLEFKSLLPRIPRAQGLPPVAARESLAPEQAFVTAAVWIRSAEELEDALRSVQRSGQVAIQMEMESGSPMRAEVRGIAFAPSPEVGYYVALAAEEKAASGALGGLFEQEGAGAENTGEYRAPLSALRPLVEDAAISKVGYNVKLAEIALERHGLHPTPFAFDVLIAAYLLNSGRSSYPLMDLAETHLGVRLEAQDAFAPQETLTHEAALILALVDPLRSKLAEVGMTDIMDRMEMPLVPVLAGMEETGLLVDRAYLEQLSARMAEQMEALAKEVYALAGEEFNISSPKQLQTILFDKLQLPTGKKVKTGYSTGADLLEQLAPKYEICRKILDYREVAKLKSTYADALPRLINPETGRVHTSLNQTVASTGRLSSSEPNLQNIPVRSPIGREIRRAFIAPPGKVLLSCDYSQIELRILAHITKDPALVKAFEAGEDVHTATAATVFGVPIDQVTPDQRRQAKTINFAVIYGQSGFSLAATLGVDPATANEWIKDYFARLPGVKRYVEETTALAHRQKYVSTLMGRRRYLPELDSGNHNIRQFAERAAVNMPIQGTAADIMKLAMIDVHRYLSQECPGGCTLLLQVHDELLFEVEEAMLGEVTPEIVRRMEAAYPLDVPLRVDAKYGPNWSEMQPVSKAR